MLEGPVKQLLCKRQDLPGTKKRWNVSSLQGQAPLWFFDVCVGSACSTHDPRFALQLLFCLSMPGVRAPPIPSRALAWLSQGLTQASICSIVVASLTCFCKDACSFTSIPVLCWSCPSLSVDSSGAAEMETDGMNPFEL